jgi:hypothetical protein
MPPSAGSKHPVPPPLDNRRLILFIVVLALMVLVGGLTMYYNLRQPVKDGGQDLFQIIKQSFNNEPTIPR